MIVIKPHKKMCLLVTLFLFLASFWGLYMVIYERSETYMIENIIPVPAVGLGLFLIIVFIGYIGVTIWAHHTIRFFSLDCGVKKFADTVLYYRDNLEKRQELGSADLYVIKNS